MTVSNRLPTRRTISSLTGLATLSIVILLASPSTMASIQAPNSRKSVNGVDLPIGPKTAQEALAADVSALAGQFKIPAAEVESQMKLQAAMDTIDFSAIDPGFAEYGSEMGSRFRLWYRSASAPTDELRTALKGAGVLANVDFERVPLNIDDLDAKAKAVYDTLARRSPDIGVTFDTAKGAVVFHVAGAPTQEQESEAARAAQENQVAYEWGDAPGVSDIGGGRPVTHAGTTCTAGFVIRSGGDRSVATAAHCGTVGTGWAYQGNVLNLEARAIDHFYDVASLDSGSVTWTNIVWDGNSQRTINQVASWSTMNIGDTVVKYGANTGYTTGTITDRHACYVPEGVGGSCDPEALWVRVHAPSGAWSQPGDSGGPAMLSTTAYGIDVGHFISNNDGIYMPQQLIGGIGMQVYTG